MGRFDAVLSGFVDLLEDALGDQAQPAPEAAHDEPTAGLSRRVKALLAGLTAVVGLATGVLTLDNQIFGGGNSSSGSTPGTVATITDDAEAKSRANRVSDFLKQCAMTTGRGYDGCAVGGILASAHIPIGSGPGEVEVTADTAVTFDLISRSTSGGVFYVRNVVEGNQARTCIPRGTGGCPDDGHW
jgi:hypothetical protein